MRNRDQVSLANRRHIHIALNSLSLCHTQTFCSLSRKKLGEIWVLGLRNLESRTLHGLPQ